VVAPLAWADSKFGAQRSLELKRALSELLKGLPRDAVQRAMGSAVLPNLNISLELLHLHSKAVERNTIGRWGQVLSFGWLGNQKWAGLSFNSPGEFAMALFAEHAAELSSLVNQELASDVADGAAAVPIAGSTDCAFDQLLPYLRGMTPSTDVCCSLIDICLANGHRQDAEAFFSLGANGSEVCVKLLAENRIPLSILRGHQHRAALLGKVLGAWGSGEEVVISAIAQDRQGLRRLLRACEGDAEIGGLAEFSSALLVAKQGAAAQEESAEVAGRALLRNFVAANRSTPASFFDDLPISWLAELRDLLPSLAIDVFMAKVRTEVDDSQAKALAERFWGDFHWREASPAQVEAAVGVLRRWGRVGALEVADLSGRAAERKRMENAEGLNAALANLPLIRLPNPDALLAPDLPPQAATLLANARLTAVEGATAALREELAQARQEARAAHRQADDLADQVRSLERKLNSMSGR